MAVDKLVDSTQLNSDLALVADAIRTKGGTTASLAFPAGFVSAVQAIPTGGGGGGDAVTNAIIDRSISGTYRNADVTKVGMYAFGSCASLTAVDFPNALAVENYAFNNCTGLASISIPSVTSIGTSGFRACNLSEVVIPSVQSIGAYAFSANTQLVSADFPVLTSIGSNAFLNSTAFNTLILRSPTVCVLENQNAFSGTRFWTGGNASVYVPSALIDSYKAADQWRLLLTNGAAVVRAIEGSEYE